ncbi:DUF1868 domain-containing protein [Synechocystis sp. CS-94]|nr:DUF1868 domain-containing protein [Synechocystis sp. CS-94]
MGRLLANATFSISSTRQRLALNVQRLHPTSKLAIGTFSICVREASVDDTYQGYINRVAPQTLAIAYEQQLVNAQGSPKFDRGKPVPFPGFSVVTPIAADDPVNQGFYGHLTTVQGQVEEILDGSFVAVPPESLHLTVADLIWDGPYQALRRHNPDFEKQLCSCLQHSFADHQHQSGPYSGCQWQVLGLLVLPRSLGVVLVPRREADYEPVIKIRRAIFQNPTLIGLGIEQQYRYTAHITLGYFDPAIEKIPDPVQVGEQLAAINDRWIGHDPEILDIHSLELRYFSDMTQFSRHDHYPVLRAS